MLGSILMQQRGISQQKPMQPMQPPHSLRETAVDVEARWLPADSVAPAVWQSKVEEEIIWKGRPSQIVNLEVFLWTIVFCWLAIPIFIAIGRWLSVKCTRYEVTTERVIITSGILNTKTEQVELYRLRDYTVERTLFQRLLGLGDLVLVSSDKGEEPVRILAVPKCRDLYEDVRAAVESLRQRRGMHRLLV